MPIIEDPHFEQPKWMFVFSSLMVQIYFMNIQEYLLRM